MIVRKDVSTYNFGDHCKKCLCQRCPFWLYCDQAKARCEACTDLQPDPVTICYHKKDVAVNKRALIKATPCADCKDHCFFYHTSITMAAYGARIDTCPKEKFEKVYGKVTKNGGKTA